MTSRIVRAAWDNTFAQDNETGSGVYAASLRGQLKILPGLSLEVLQRRSHRLPRAAAGRALGRVADLLWINARLPAILRKGRFELLHAPAFIAPIASPCPLVITIHDITYLKFPSHFARRWTAYMRRIGPRIVRSAAAIVCVSEHSRQDVIRAYDLAPDKVRTVHNGVDHQRFRPGATLDADWAATLGIRAGYLLHVGALVERKNIPVLLRAISELRSRGKWDRRQLVLAGTASPGMTGTDEIQAAIKELQLSDVVVLAGRVPDAHLPGLYAHAVALVMPSLYEGFGFPVVEAMAAGTPVIASNATSLPEVAGDAALLVPPRDSHALADAIIDVLEHPTNANEFRARGLQRARQYTWERCAAETLAVYRSVAGS